MQSFLPPELAEQVLLRTPSKDLSSLCRSSHLYYDICLSPIFWKRRFNLPFPLSSLADTSNFTLEQWIELDERVEKSFSCIPKRIKQLKKKKEIVLWLTGSEEERKVMVVSGINYSLYESIIPRILEVDREHKWLSKEVDFYMEEYDKSGDEEDLEHAKLYGSLIADLERFYLTMRLFYKEGRFYYIFSQTLNVHSDSYPLSEEEVKRLLFLLNFYDLDYFVE